MKFSKKGLENFGFQKIIKLTFVVMVLVLLVGCQPVQKEVSDEVVDSTPTGDIEVSQELDDLDDLDGLDSLDDLDSALDDLDNLPLE